MRIKTNLKAGKKVTLDVAKQFTVPIPTPAGPKVNVPALKLADGKLFVEVTGAGWREP